MNRTVSFLSHCMFYNSLGAWCLQCHSGGCLSILGVCTTRTRIFTEFVKLGKALAELPCSYGEVWIREFPSLLCSECVCVLILFVWALVELRRVVNCWIFDVWMCVDCCCQFRPSTCCWQIRHFQRMRLPGPLVILLACCAKSVRKKLVLLQEKYLQWLLISSKFHVLSESFRCNVQALFICLGFCHWEWQAMANGWFLSS